MSTEPLPPNYQTENMTPDRLRILQRTLDFMIGEIRTTEPNMPDAVLSALLGRLVGHLLYNAAPWKRNGLKLLLAINVDVAVQERVELQALVEMEQAGIQVMK